MNPEQFYSDYLNRISKEIEGLEKKENNLERLRFLVFFGGIGFIFLIVLSKYVVLFPLALVFIAFFIGVVQRHEKIKSALLALNRKKGLGLKEQKALTGDYSSFKDGHEYQDPGHDYTSDLDIFGKQSLFQYFNRTSTPAGRDRLASWFQKPSNQQKILDRQAAVQELNEFSEWMLDFRSAEVSEKLDAIHVKSFLYWIRSSREVFFSKYIKNWIRLSPWLLSMFFMVFFIQLIFPEWVEIHPNLFWALPDLILPIFLINLLIVRSFLNKTNTTHQTLSGQFPVIKAYSELIQKVEEVNFLSPELLKIKEDLNGRVRASSLLRQLALILEKFDRRLNILISIITNGLFLSDLKLLNELDNWREQHQEKPLKWMNALSELEALVSLGTVGFNELDWVFPIFSITPKTLIAREMGHPLIPPSKRINNSFELISPNQVILVTGSNMAGKSTFLRTIGINLILAQMGSKVCATFFQYAPISLYTSLRIVDSLQENTSSFYAELKRLEVLIKRTGQGEDVFFLLDEILRGTNSNDRHLGSKAVVQHLVKNHAVGILATHDLGLGQMVVDYPKEIRNQHFDVSVIDEELVFDYTLKDGICTSLNASILMKKIGLDLEGVESF